MISAADMASMQATSVASLDMVCVITHVATFTTDQYGMSQPGTPTVTTTMCNIAAPKAGMLALYADLIGSQKAFLVRTSAAIVPAQGDALLIAGELLTVQVLLQPESYSTANQVLAVEIK